MKYKALTATCFLLLLTGCESAFDKSFNKVLNGLSEENVIALLGEPDERSNLFHLSQKIGYEKEYEKAANANATYWLFWKRDIDIIYAVGFSKQKKVVYKAVGGT